MAETVGPYTQDVLTHIINVQWGGEQFVYVGTEAPGPNLSYCTSGWSGNGTKWNYNSEFRVGGETGLSCCISGASVIVAGGSRSYIVDEFHELNGPIVAISANNGDSWSDDGLPMLDLVLEPMPAFKSRSGSCDAIGYDPGGKTFYATTTYFTPHLGTWQMIMYARPAVGGWEQVYSQDLGDLPGGSFFPMPPYPEKTRLCNLVLTDPASTRADIDYRSCNAKGQIMKRATADGIDMTVEIDGGTLLINGVATSIPSVDVVSSACLGAGCIIAAGYTSSSRPVVFRSVDAGRTWINVDEITATDLGSVGAVSFS